MVYRFIDLFCGIGGFHQALIQLNSKCVFACDIDENCRKVYEKNYGIKPEGDIKANYIGIIRVAAQNVLAAVRVTLWSCRNGNSNH